VSADPIAAIAEAIRREVPGLEAGAVALIDSPRFPRDLDGASGARIVPAPARRAIDAALQSMVRCVNGARRRVRPIRLSMFPTPAVSFFESCAAGRNCKPHLRSIARAILPPPRPPGVAATKKITGGRLFTRFMLGGFAAYPALEALGVGTFESYPYLAFTLSRSGAERLPPKSKRAQALFARRRIIARLARALELSRVPAVSTLDQADAAIMAIAAALGARRGGLVAVESSAEGRFIAALDTSDARHLAARLAAAPPAGPA